jgi:hypothetical protein
MKRRSDEEQLKELEWLQIRRLRHKCAEASALMIFYGAVD